MLISPWKATTHCAQGILGAGSQMPRGEGKESKIVDLIIIFNLLVDFVSAQQYFLPETKLGAWSLGVAPTALIAECEAPAESPGFGEAWPYTLQEEGGSELCITLYISSELAAYTQGAAITLDIAKIFKQEK